MCINKWIYQVDIYSSPFFMAYAQAMVELEDSNGPCSEEKS